MASRGRAQVGIPLQAVGVHSVAIPLWCGPGRAYLALRVSTVHTCREEAPKKRGGGHVLGVRNLLPVGLGLGLVKFRSIPVHLLLGEYRYGVRFDGHEK